MNFCLALLLGFEGNQAGFPNTAENCRALGTPYPFRSNCQCLGVYQLDVDIFDDGIRATYVR